MRTLSTDKTQKKVNMDTCAHYQIVSVRDLTLNCENPRHKQHLQRFLKKYPTADKNGEFAIIKINPEDWAVDLERPEKNTVKCCQMCSIQEDIKRVTSPR